MKRLLLATIIGAAVLWAAPAAANVGTLEPGCTTWTLHGTRFLPGVHLFTLRGDVDGTAYSRTREVGIPEAVGAGRNDRVDIDVEFPVDDLTADLTDVAMSGTAEWFGRGEQGRSEKVTVTLVCGTATTTAPPPPPETTTSSAVTTTVETTTTTEAPPPPNDSTLPKTGREHDRRGPAAVAFVLIAGGAYLLAWLGLGARERRRAGHDVDERG